MGFMICDCIGEFTIYDLRFAIALDHLGIDSFAGGRLYSTAAHCTGGSSSRSTEYGVGPTDARDSPAPQASGCLSEANPQGRKGPSASLPLHIRGGRNELRPSRTFTTTKRRRHDTSVRGQSYHLPTTIYQLPTTIYQLPTTNYQLSTQCNRKSQIVNP